MSHSVPPPENTPAPVPAAVAPSPKHSAFVGRFGLRAGWGIFLMVFVWFLLSALGGVLGIAATGHLGEIAQARAQARQQAHARPGAPRPAVHIPMVPALPLVQDGLLFAGLLVVCFLLSRGEQRPLAVFGLARNRWPDVLPGAFWGLAIMAALVGTLRALHLLAFEGRALTGPAVAASGLKWLLAFCLVGLAEEYSFRGYVQYTLMRGLWGLAERLRPADPRPLAFWAAAALLSALFALLHSGNGGETGFGLLAVFLAAMTFCYALWRTGSLWWAVGFHAAWDWAQSFVFGVADSGSVSVGRLFATHPLGNPLLSGGSDGPEGSLLVIPALLLAMLAIRFTRRGPQPSPAPEPPNGTKLAPLLHIPLA